MHAIVDGTRKTAHLSAPREPAGRKAQLARVYRSESLKRGFHQGTNTSNARAKVPFVAVLRF